MLNPVRNYNAIFAILQCVKTMLIQQIIHIFQHKKIKKNEDKIYFHHCMENDYCYNWDIHYLRYPYVIEP